MKKVAIGIDIGGTNTKIGIIDRDGETITYSKIRTTEKFSEYLKELAGTINNDIEKAGKELDIIGIGIGSPNASNTRGTIEYPPNLKWGDIIYFVDEFKNFFDYPIVFTNDANAAAVGEMVYGNAKGMKDFILLTLGTGLGSGIVCNGQLIHGHHGFAGEFGHTLVNINGRFCGCGRRGCLETYVSATGIKRTVYKLLADFTDDSELRDVSYDNLNAKMITEAAKREDKVAVESFAYTGRVLGMKLADAVVHTDPEAIFLFGGLVRAGKHLFEPTQYHFEKNTMKTFKGKVKLLESGLMDKNAAVLGASALAWNEYGD